MTATSPWDYPQDLSNALARLEALWDRAQNPLYAWRAVELCCLEWEDADGNLTGPHQPPLWCFNYLAICAGKLRGIACMDPLPTGHDECPRLVSEALGLTSKGRNEFRNWSNEMMNVTEAFVFDEGREKGIKPARIHQILAKSRGADICERAQQDRITKGRRTIKTSRKARPPTR